MKDHMNRDPRASNDVGGLYVKDGRLINERPVGMTGIQEASNLRRMKKDADKENTIAKGIELAEMREKMRDMF
tara:strand:+ start:112 stop:330 length:219 start_codon:yes stop_codon:yes gene_type:complete